MQQTRPLLFALIANGAGHAYFAISLPTIARSMTMSDISVGMIMSLSALLLIITAPIWGWMCDKFGRKLVLTIGLLSSAITTFMLAMLIEFVALLPALFANLLFTIRAVQAGLSAGLKPATQATVSDITQSNNRMQAMGVMGATFGAGTVIGGLMAVLSGQSWLVEGFIALSAIMALSSFWVIAKLPETHNQTVTATRHFNLRAVALYLASTTLSLTIYSGLQPITSWILQDQFALNGDQTIKFTGAIMMSSMLAMIMTQIVLSRCKTFHLDKQSSVRKIGSLISSIALIACVFSSSTPLFAASMGLLGIGLGLFLPANLALMTEAVSHQQQGKLAGMNGLCQGLGLALGPIMASLAYQYHYQLAYYLSAAAMGALLLITQRQGKPSQQNSHSI
ncbi:MFS transporter [Vibrio intestinalis]|uniref:MFS transporter n=1 Tax=Vibrio intestinalis TaxID=2933291 RepID=UPI0021A905AE|nr:MFS transporter [Vibrio intestinalis]